MNSVSFEIIKIIDDDIKEFSKHSVQQNANNIRKHNYVCTLTFFRQHT